MLKYIKNSFGLTNRYIILATPLILFSLLSSLYILFSTNGNIINLLIALILFILMFAAFLSGWSYMLKMCVQNEDIEDPNLIIKDFPAGVGEFFVPVLGCIFNIFILSVIIFIFTYIVGMKTIGHIGIQASAISGAFDSAEALRTFLNSLTDEQLFKLNLWNLLLFGMMGLEYFMIIFYIPALVFKNKNPFKAFGAAMKDLFSKKIFKNILLYLIIFISYSVLSVITTVAGANIVVHFIMTLINFYYLVFAAVLIFEYYYSNFVQIGANFDERV